MTCPALPNLPAVIHDVGIPVAIHISQGNPSRTAAAGRNGLLPEMRDAGRVIAGEADDRWNQQCEPDELHEGYP
jgi:hypothetical protein